MAYGEAPELTSHAEGRVGVDFGAPGPFFTLTPGQVVGLVHALARAGWITVNGQHVIPNVHRPRT